MKTCIYINIHIFVSKHIFLRALGVPGTVLGLEIQQKRWILNNSNYVITLLSPESWHHFIRGPDGGVGSENGSLRKGV